MQGEFLENLKGVTVAECLSLIQPAERVGDLQFLFHLV